MTHYRISGAAGHPSGVTAIPHDFIRENEVPCTKLDNGDDNCNTMGLITVCNNNPS